MVCMHLDRGLDEINTLIHADGVRGYRQYGAVSAFLASTGTCIFSLQEMPRFNVQNQQKLPY